MFFSCRIIVSVIKQLRLIKHQSLIDAFHSQQSLQEFPPVDGEVCMHWHKSQASKPVTFRGCSQMVFRRLNVLKLRSAVAVETGSVASIWKRFLTFGKIANWHSNSASIAFDGRFSSTPSHFLVHRWLSAETTTWLAISSWYWVSKRLIWSSVAEWQSFGSNPPKQRACCSLVLKPVL